MREALFKNNSYNWEQAPTQQQAAQQLRNFIAKMNKNYSEIQTPKTEQLRKQVKSNVLFLMTLINTIQLIYVTESMLTN